jgi:hypothetical protein
VEMPSPGQTAGRNILQIDLKDATFKILSTYAARIGKLLNSDRATSSPALIACLDDFLGGVYALIYAKQNDFRDKSSLPIEVAAITVRAEQLAKGLVRTDGKWMAGFYFNSALFRISGTYHRFLKLVVGKNGDVGALRPLAEELYRQRVGEDWKNSNVRAIHGQATDLKHAVGGIYEGRRVDAGFQNAVEAIGELLDLVEAWK